MELLFIVLIGIALGLVAFVALPVREEIGPALLPAIGGASAAIVWVALTWARLKWDQPLIWTLTIVAAALTVCGAGLLLRRGRIRSDDALFADLARRAA